MSISKSQLISLCEEFNAAVEGKLMQDPVLIQKLEASPPDGKNIEDINAQIADFQLYIVQSPELVLAIESGEKTLAQLGDENPGFAEKYIALMDTGTSLAYDIVVEHNADLFISSVPEAGRNEDTIAALEQAGAPNIAKAFRLSLG